MNNKFFNKRIAVKGQSIFSQNVVRKPSLIGQSASNKTGQTSGQQMGQCLAVKKSNQLSKTAYKCRFFGCNRIFFSILTFNCHKRQHLMSTQKPLEYRRPVSNHQLIVNNPDSCTSGDRQTNCTDLSTSKPSDQLMDSIMRPVPQKGFGSSKKVRMYYTTDVYLNQKRFICEFCGYRVYGVRGSTRMATHINGQHLKRYLFRCDVDGCDRKFGSPNNYRIHKMNHLCGFGIKNGKTLNTVCGNKSINRFRGHIVTNGFKFFKCNYNVDTDCTFVTNNSNAIKRHIHDSHLCPNRIRFKTTGQTARSQTAINSIDLYQRFGEFCEEFYSDGQKFFRCRSCLFMTENIKGIIAHIKLKHFAPKQKSYFFKCQTIKILHTKGLTGHLNNNSSVDNSFYSSETDSKPQDNYNNGNNITVGSQLNKLRFKAFNRKDKLNKWLPFNCKTCGKSFDDLSILRQHIKKHE